MKWESSCDTGSTTSYSGWKTCFRSNYQAWILSKQISRETSNIPQVKTLDFFGQTMIALPLFILDPDSNQAYPPVHTVGLESAVTEGLGFHWYYIIPSTWNLFHISNATVEKFHWAKDKIGYICWSLCLWANLSKFSLIVDIWSFYLYGHLHGICTVLCLQYIWGEISHV